jgi:ADP-ribose pyrophosphatase YjhB (NUDIX family)
MSAFVAVVQNRKVFVVRAAKSGKWMLPGGGINKGESAEKAACRELREESGVKIGESELEKIGTVVDKKGTNCTLFMSTQWPSRHLSLSKIFKDRTTRKETDSWGIATLQKGKWEVCVEGSKTNTSNTFRGGTLTHLIQLKPRLKSTFTDLTY